MRCFIIMMYIFLIVLGCIIVLHIVSTWKASHDFKILQVPCEGLVPDVLNRKYPVVVEPPMSPGEVAKRCQDAGFFKTMTMHHLDKSVIKIVDHDHHVIHCDQDCLVSITHPTLDAEMSIKLYNDHCLVLPHRWGYIADENVRVIQVGGPVCFGIRMSQTLF